MVCLIYLFLDIKKDVIFDRLCLIPSYMFPAAHFSPAISYHSISIEDDRGDRTVFIDIYYRIDQLHDTTASVTGRRMFICLGNVPELLVTFAKACYEILFSLFLVLSWNELHVTLYDAPGVLSIREWKKYARQGYIWFYGRQRMLLSFY